MFNVIISLGYKYVCTWLGRNQGWLNIASKFFSFPKRRKLTTFSERQKWTIDCSKKLDALNRQQFFDALNSRQFSTLWILDAMVIHPNQALIAYFNLFICSVLWAGSPLFTAPNASDFFHCKCYWTSLQRHLSWSQHEFSFLPALVQPWFECSGVNRFDNLFREEMLPKASSTFIHFQLQCVASGPIVPLTGQQICRHRLIVPRVVGKHFEDFNHIFSQASIFKGWHAKFFQSLFVG